MGNASGRFYGIQKTEEECTMIPIVRLRCPRGACPELPVRPSGRTPAGHTNASGRFPLPKTGAVSIPAVEADGVEQPVRPQDGSPRSGLVTVRRFVPCGSSTLRYRKKPSLAAIQYQCYAGQSLLRWRA